MNGLLLFATTMTVEFADAFSFYKASLEIQLIGMLLETWNGVHLKSIHVA